MRVELRGVRFERREGVGQDGHVLVFDVDQVASALGGPLGLGHDHRHLVAGKAHDIGAGPG